MALSAPTAPSYTLATKEGIDADIATLALRRQIEQASALGQGYVANGAYFDSLDKLTAAKDANRTKLTQTADALAVLQAAYDKEQQARKKSSFWGSLGNIVTGGAYGLVDDLMKGRAGDSWRNLPGTEVLNKLIKPGANSVASALEQAKADLEAAKKADASFSSYQDFNGLGDDVLSRKYLDISLDGADQTARRQLALRKELGVSNVEQTIAELKAADPAAYEARMKIQRGVEGDLLGYDPESGDLGSLIKGARADFSAGPSRDFLRLRDDARNGLDSLGSSNLARIRNDARAEYALGSKLDASTAHEVEQASRAAQASRGNILGIGAAAQEAMTLGSVGEARKAQRTAALGVADSAYFDRSNALGSLLSGYDSAVSADKDRRAANLAGYDSAVYGRKQQNLANASSFLLGSPITAQFNTLAGAQNGAVNYSPSGVAKGIGLNANAAQSGANFAQQNYATAIDVWKTKAAQGNPWTNVISGVVGAGAGAFTGGLGTGVAAGATKGLLG